MLMVRFDVICFMSLYTDYDLSLIWVAALKSPIVEDRPPLIPFRFQEVEYFAFKPLAIRGFDTMPMIPEPNFLFSQDTFSARNPFTTFSARNPFTKKKIIGFKKPTNTALQQLREALVRCYTEDVSVNRMQSIWNFELIQSVMDV